ncbi:MAG: DUF2141 domain-containing protein [Burkholderiaceae bacterium]
MKRYLPCLVFAVAAFAALPAVSATLTVEITGVTQTAGKMMIAVYDSEASFRQQAVRQRIEAPVKGTMRIAFDGLPAGPYAITLFQDLNGDGELNTKLFGIPAEPWGASSNGKGSFGAPTWEAASVPLPAGGATVTIGLE